MTYYDPSWQPVYTYPANVAVDRLVNINVPGAVTVVPSYDFGRVIDPTIITRVDPQTITRVRPVLNPLAVDDLRTVAFQTREARQRIDVPRQVIQRFDTPVVASTITAPRFRQDLAKAMRVERVDDRVRNQKLQVRDQRVTDQRAAAPAQIDQGNVAAEQARERQIADLSRQAARGDKNARQQLQDLRKQQADQRAAERANIQAQGQQVGQPAPQQDQKQMERQQQQAQREAARQQMIQSQQQQRQAAQQQVQAQREQRRNQAQQEQRTRNAQQQQMLKSQPKRQPPQAAPRPPQAQPQPNRVQSVPQAQRRRRNRRHRPSHARRQCVAPQAQQKAEPKAQPPAQAKPPGKKKPGGE